MSTGRRTFPPTAGTRRRLSSQQSEDHVVDVTTPSPARDDRWLSLGPASRLLGVDPDTLRRWSDEGRVATWTTPGGHRRFERRTIERMAVDRRPGAALRPLASLGASPARLQRAYREHYASRLAPMVTDTPRDERERDDYRRDGRRLVETLVAFLDAQEDETGRAAAEAEAIAVVDDHASRLAERGVSLTESVSMFVTARQPFLAEIAGLGRRRALDPARLAALYESASMLLDRLLLRFIVSHQRGRGG